MHTNSALYVQLALEFGLDLDSGRSFYSGLQNLGLQSRLDWNGIRFDSGESDTQLLMSNFDVNPVLVKPDPVQP